MFETPLTVVGRIITDPTLRHVGDQQVVRFRMASNTRRRLPDGNWEAGTSLYLTVSCWSRLASGVAGHLTKGDPVVVAGVAHTSEYVDREGLPRSSLELRASAVGPDLGRCTAQVSRPARSAAEDGAAADAGPVPGGDATDVATDDPTDVATDVTTDAATDPFIPAVAVGDERGDEPGPVRDAGRAHNGPDDPGDPADEGLPLSA